MRIIGIKEERGENVDEKIVRLFNSYLQTDSAHSMFSNRTFERAHRLGKFDPQKTRVILVKFAHFKDKLEAFKFSSRLRSQNVFLTDDYPEEMDSDRRIMSQIHSALKSAKETHASPHVKSLYKKQDKLVLNDHIYTVDNLHELPQQLQLKSLFTPTKNGITAFFSKYSPLSNFYPCKFEINGASFDTMERYYRDAIKKSRVV